MRAVTCDGTVHNLDIVEGCHLDPFTAHWRGRIASGSSPALAAMALAIRCGWEVRELVPSDEATRDEALAAISEENQRVVAQLRQELRAIEANAVEQLIDPLLRRVR